MNVYVIEIEENKNQLRSPSFSKLVRSKVFFFCKILCTWVTIHFCRTCLHILHNYKFTFEKYFHDDDDLLLVTQSIIHLYFCWRSLNTIIFKFRWKLIIFFCCCYFYILVYTKIPTSVGESRLDRRDGRALMNYKSNETFVIQTFYHWKNVELCIWRYQLHFQCFFVMFSILTYLSILFYAGL
jgi:hypothetical protein